MFLMIFGGRSTTISLVFWRRFVLWSVFVIVKLVEPLCQVHPYVLLPRLFEKVSVSWCLGTLLLHAAPSCVHLPFVHKYLLAKSGKGLWGFPCLVTVASWKLRVLQLLVCPPPTVLFICIWISSSWICCMLIIRWGRILDTCVETSATGVGWMVGKMVGYGFGVGF